MASEDRDQQFERALWRHLASASPDLACPDAETLAAYQASTLSPEETSHWKQHIASCDRCQEILSLVGQTEDFTENLQEQDELVPMAAHMPSAAAPVAMRAQHQALAKSPDASKPALPPSSRVTSFRPRPRLSWLVPVGAVAAGIIVWIGVHGMRTQYLQNRSELQVAQNRPAPAPPPKTVSPLSDEEQMSKLEKPRSATTAPQPALTAPAKGTTAKSNLPPSAPTELARRKKDSAQSDAALEAERQNPSFAAGYVEKSRSAENLPAEARSVPAPEAAPLAAGDKVSAKAKNQKAKEAAGAPAPAASSSYTSEISAQNVTNRVRDSLDLVQVASGDPRYIVAPGEAHAWRVGLAGRIERSTDRGKTWKLQNSGVSADLTAGSATSDKVCWVVGKSGTLLRTTDGGKHWQTLASPIAADIGGIYATDALHASIWDVPNRQSYETSDGGATWSRSANE